jgi:hypothetical protein
MSKSSFEENLEARADLFKALGHPARMLIVNLIRMKPRHGEELAAILKLKPATISHHLGKLSQAGLLTSKKDQYYQTYSIVPALLKRSLSDLVSLPQPDLRTEVREDAYRRKVLKTFFRHGRLTGIPAQLKKRQIILEKLVEEFEPGRDYPEIEVNRILVEFHEDVASLRREFISFKLMKRTTRGVYRRT